MWYSGLCIEWGHAYVVQWAVHRGGTSLCGYLFNSLHYLTCYLAGCVATFASTNTTALLCSYQCGKTVQFCVDVAFLWVVRTAKFKCHVNGAVILLLLWRH